MGMGGGIGGVKGLNGCWGGGSVRIGGGGFLGAVWDSASQLGFIGLASTSRNSNTSTSVFGISDKFAVDEEFESSGNFLSLLEGDDLGQGGRGA